MANPWEEIRLMDYEWHMGWDSVMQLQALDAMMEKQFQYPASSIMVLGVAGGNGLRHIRPGEIRQVFGVDINASYLAACEKRYPKLKGVFHPLCADLTSDPLELPRAELIVANLLIEYIGYVCFQKAVLQVSPLYVSCGIQADSTDQFVSETPYQRRFDGLDAIHHAVEEGRLREAMQEIQYQLILRDETLLPNGKKLIRLDFQRTEKTI